MIIIIFNLMGSRGKLNETISNLNSLSYNVKWLYLGEDA